MPRRTTPLAAPAAVAGPPSRTLALAVAPRSGRDLVLDTVERAMAPADAGIARSWLINVRGGWRDRPPAERTLLTYAHGLCHLAKHLHAAGGDLVTATRPQILDWMAALRAERAAKTAIVYLTAARAFYDWLVAEGDIAEAAHPVVRVRAPEPPERVNHPLTPAEIDRVLASVDPKTLVGLRNRAMFLTFLDTGLRVAELVGLDTVDVDWRYGYLVVMGKGSRERRVRVSPTTLSALDRYVRARQRAGDRAAPLWTTSSGARLSRVRVQQLHTDIGRRLGFHLHPHRWRHTTAQALLDSGMDRESVRVLLGHADLRTLRIYTGATDAARALAAHAQHSPVEQLRARKGKR